MSIDYKVDVKSKRGKSGASEFRSLECFSFVIKIIKKQNEIGFKYETYDSIDICGKYNITIPKVYYPPNKKNKFISNILVKDLEVYLNEKGIDLANFYNELIYSKIKEFKLERVETNPQISKKVYEIN